jgi:hypothetical protein
VADWHWPSGFVLPMKHRKCLVASIIDGVNLGDPQRSANVPLPDWATRTGREHVVVSLFKRLSKLVLRQHDGELPRDGNCAGGAIRLRRLTVSAPVALPCELDFGVVQIVQSDIGPSQRKEL